MASRRKRCRDSIDVDKTVAENEIYHTLYSMKRKKIYEDVEEGSDNGKLLKSINKDTYINQKANTSYCKLGKSTNARSLLNVDSSCSISNFRSRVTRTYASPKRNLCSKIDEVQHISTSVPSLSYAVNNNSESSQEEVKEEDEGSEETNSGVLRVSLASGKTTEGKAHEFRKFLSCENAIDTPCKDDDCEVSVLEHSADTSECHKPTGHTSENSSVLVMNEQQHVAELSLTNSLCNKIQSTSSNIPLTYSYTTISPVLQPMYGAGVPSQLSHQYVTSAIAAVSTPIPTVPVLPEIVRGVTCGTKRLADSGPRQGESRNASPSKLPSTSESPVKQTVSYSSYNPHCVQGNNLHVYHYNFNAETEDEKKDIVIEDEEIDLCENTSLSVIDFSCEADSSKVKEESDNALPSKISKGVSTSEDFVQTESWGTYLLQKLEVLYEQEQECDLILKFCGGETLKVHRAIVLACTSLVSGPDAAQCRGEYMVPSDLNYSHVEPVIRFVYSGRFDIDGPQEEVAAIYSAACRLQVPLLTRLMDSRFPHLLATCTPRRRLPIWKRNPKFIHHNKEYSKKRCNKLYETGKKYHITACKSARPRSITVRELSSSSSKETEAESLVKDTTDNNEIGLMEEDDGSMYLVLQKGKNIVKADAVIRSKFAAERARPTRFELEEDSENSQLQIATWSSKASSMPSFFSGTGHNQVTTSATSNNSLTSSNASSLSAFDAILASSTPISHQSPRRRRSSAADDKSVNYVNQTLSSYDDPNCDGGSDDHGRKYREKEVDQSGNEMDEETDCVHISDRNSGAAHHDTEVIDSRTRKYAEYESKYPSQNESCTDEDLTPYDYKVDEEDQNFGVTTCKPQPRETKGDSSISIKSSLVISNADLPAKSILKKKKDKNPERKEKKHVSFPLDENNEVINEVATYSHAKEPAQSLIEVKKNIGGLKSSGEPCSPVKLTLSMKKKALMNIALDDSEPIEVTNCEKKESCRKYVSSKQSSSQDKASKGDLSGHAKIISEVLKKYPNLVKDKKNVRLKILKKGNDKNNGGNGTKSRVQYLMLSEGEMKGKSGNKLSKTSAGSHVKQDSNSSSRTVAGSNRFECPGCERVFQSYFTFKNHVSSEHKDQSSAILAGVENVPFACYTCFLNEPLEFSDYFSYQQHMQDIHSNTETRACNICGFRPKKKLELAYHQYSEHNKVPRNFSFPKCDLCDFVAMNDSSLLKHRSQHANADSYTCSVCGVTFCSFGALQGHMQTKLCQSKPTTSYKCPHCPLTFARSYNLKAHCKSSHRSVQTSVQIIPGASREVEDNTPKDTVNDKTRESGKRSEVVPSRAGLEDGQGSGSVMAATPQSSSEAEALSTVASSLVASLGLPEETVSQYMYTQGCTMNGEKVSGRVSGNEGVSIQLVETTPPVSGYQEEHALCHDVTYTTQAALTNSTNVSALYPVSVVSNPVVGTQIVPGQIPVLSSQVLQGGCISTAGGSILGPAPHSWAYVTYQVPASSDDLPTVMTEAASMSAANVTSNQEASSDTNFQSSSDMPSHQQINVEISNNDKNRNSGISNCEQLNSLVVVTNTSSQMENINQPSVFL